MAAGMYTLNFDKKTYAGIANLMPKIKQRIDSVAFIMGTSGEILWVSADALAGASQCVYSTLGKTLEEGARIMVDFLEEIAAVAPKTFVLKPAAPPPASKAAPRGRLRAAAREASGVGKTRKPRKPPGVPFEVFMRRAPMPSDMLARLKAAVFKHYTDKRDEIEKILKDHNALDDLPHIYDGGEERIELDVDKLAPVTQKALYDMLMPEKA